MIQIYSLFDGNKDFIFKNPIERKGNKEFMYFLYIGKDSCGEVQSMLIVANELEKIELDNFQYLYNHSLEVSKNNLRCN